MIQRKTLTALMLALTMALVAAGSLAAQDRQAQHIFTPMASPRAEVAQRVGLTDIEVTYHRPAVNERDIWGQVVPSAGTPVWRTGANENTLISFSTDVTVQGQALPAGTYGVHSIPGQPAAEGEWTIVFSKDIHAWGSFAYNEENDALRVTAKPESAPHKERLEISFDDLEDDSANLILRWAEVAVPVKVGIDLEGTVTASFKQQLTGLSSFFWQGWNQAAQYNLANDMNLEEAVAWADRSIGIQETFNNLSTKAQLLEKQDDVEQAKTIMAKAMAMGNAGQIHNYARQLLGRGMKDEALVAFKKNVDKHPETWFVELGLARGYSALGDFENAAKSMKASLEKAPDPQKQYVQGLVDQLEKGTDIN
ncbi:MAG: DUF2911 domain-containing protein [bacterium]|nr:DUF2911 domain-containing protein [bacterium]